MAKKVTYNLLWKKRLSFFDILFDNSNAHSLVTRLLTIQKSQFVFTFQSYNMISSALLGHKLIELIKSTYP